MAGGGQVGGPPQGYTGEASALGGAGYVKVGGTGDAGAHAHAVTDHLHEPPTITVAANGSAATNANIPPGVVLNFIMRMH